MIYGDGEHTHLRTYNSTHITHDMFGQVPVVSLLLHSGYFCKFKENEPLHSCPGSKNGMDTCRSLEWPSIEGTANIFKSVVAAGTKLFFFCTVTHQLVPRESEQRTCLFNRSLSGVRPFCKRRAGGCRQGRWIRSE